MHLSIETAMMLIRKACTSPVVEVAFPSCNVQWSLDGLQVYLQEDARRIDAFLVGSELRLVCSDAYGTMSATIRL